MPKTRTSKSRLRRKREAIIVPPSPYSFEETVARILKVKPTKPTKPAKKTGRKKPTS